MLLLTEIPTIRFMYLRRVVQKKKQEYKPTEGLLAGGGSAL